MVARLRSWWQRIKQHPVRSAVSIGAGLLGIALLVAFIGGYVFNWEWTGLSSYTPPVKDSNFQRGKTLWDWLNLLGVLAIPAVVGLGAAWYTAQQGKESDRENTDNQRETALQAYIDKMSELLLHEKLRDSAEEDEVRKIARVRTLTILARLDADRKSNVLLFLHESGLIHMDKRIIDLSHADLKYADLRNANLSEANLSYADLRNADLSGAYLIEANLSFANLSGVNLSYVGLSGAKLFNADLSEANLSYVGLSEAKLFGAKLFRANLFGAKLFRASLIEVNLSGANLSGADLSEVNLSGAIVTSEQLDKAKLLKDTIMPDGSKHP